VLGQALGLPTTMGLYSFIGAAVTSAAVIIYPGVPEKDLWEPVTLISRFSNPAVLVVALFSLSLATLATNIAANVVSPANDFSNAFPRFISFRTGGLITGLIGIVMQPWRLLESGDRYIGWLITLSGGMGTVAGVLIADYWLVRRRKLQLEDLYLPQGRYSYRGGWNTRAVIATAIGCFLAWGGLAIPPLAPLVDYGWFVGAFGAAVSYLIAHRWFAPKPHIEVMPV